MEIQRAIRAAGVAVAAGLLAGASGAAHAARELIQTDGSSTVYPITEAVAEEFQKAQRGAVQVTVGISGTGGGFKKFCRGETDLSNASRPILKEEMAECAKNGVKYIELPIAYDALTLAVSRQNGFVDHLTVAELKKMWGPEAQGAVTSWRQVRKSFPDEPLQLAGAGADSGTFDYFTEAIVGKAKSQRGDYQATEDDNVTIQFVSRSRNAIGYLGLAYYLENRERVRAVPIKQDEGSPAVLPAVDTVNSGTYQPLSRPIFVYVKEASLARPAVRRFVEFYLEQAAELAREVGYVDLPAKAYDLGRENLERRKLGTAFGGVPEVGVKVEELLAREGKL